MSSERTQGELTTPVGPGTESEVEVQSFTLSAIEGPAPASYVSTRDRCSIGSHALNDLVIDDPTVSRFHCEIRLEPGGAYVYDLNSRNRTVVDGVTVREALLRSGTTVRLGNAVLRFDLGPKPVAVRVSSSTRFGGMTGRSPAMRAVFAVLERAAATDVTVLLEGETGTGKGVAAAAIHQHGARRAGPFVVIDCGAIALNLIESELFGHERGAFTGAGERRVGAFEQAGGGTVFLDEIGELPLEMQPKLLRVLENRELRRVGGNAVVPVDVRLVAATNRDLRAEVNAGRFRGDLYFRLAVVRVALPPLRQRPEDLPALIEGMLAALGAGDDQRAALLRPESLAELERAAWPGNVRELRNHVERSIVFRDELDAPPPPMADEEAPAVAAAPPPDVSLGLIEARERELARFERRYLEELMRAHGGRVQKAADAAGITRVYLYRLLRKHGLQG